MNFRSPQTPGVGGIDELTNAEEAFLTSFAGLTGQEGYYLKFVSGAPVWTTIAGGGTPAISVADETTYGIASAVGVSTNYARQDHTHGTMATPTKTTVGLSNVDNTADTAKPVSTAQQTALNLKADLASPTFSGTPSLPTGTTATTQSAADSTTKLATTAFVTTADNLKAPLASPAFTGTPTGITATHVGLGNVTNTSDANKPVSTAQQTALDGKSATSHNHTGVYAPVLGVDDNYVTDAEKVVIGNTSGTNSGDNAVNSNYSGLVSNATHTGDAEGATALTVKRINGVALSGLATGILKNTTTTGVPSIATNADLPVMSATVGGAVPTPPNNTTTFLRGDGTFATPTGGAGDMVLATVQTNSALKTFLNATLGIRNVANTITSLFLTTATVARTWTLKDADGTLAFTSDITGVNSGTNTGDQTAIPNATLATMLTKTYKGNTTVGTATPTDVPIATLKTDLALVKSDVGLGSVDNTSDSAKPVSTATQSALDLKAPINNAAFTGTFAAPAGTVTLAMQANMATASVVYRKTVGVGVPEVNTLATLKTDLVLVKGDVGLGSVDNTTDAGKPVSTAQQTALNLKADLVSPTFTGTPLAPTAAAGTNTTQLASTAFVTAINNNGSYRNLLEANASHIAGRVAGTYALAGGNAAAISGTGTLYPIASLHIVGADFPTVNGIATKLRIRAQLYVNDVAPTGNFTFGLYPITRPATSGGAGLNIFTLGTVVAGSNGATFTAPAADLLGGAVGADFAIPADGHYALGVVTTGTVAASSHVHLHAQLQMRNT